MNYLILCLTISVVIVYIYNIVDFPHNFIARLLSFLYKREIPPERVSLPKIFECSLCATFWSTLVILLVFQPYHWFFAFIFAFSTKYIEFIITIIDRLLSKIFIKIIEFLQK